MIIIISLRHRKPFTPTKDKILLRMNRQCSSTKHSYHVHKVPVSQESVLKRSEIIDYEMSVIDTHPGDREKPTVVGLCGQPGFPLDFEPLIQRLAEKNIRFLGPVFPGLETSDVESWKLYHQDYTSTGQACLLEQVLNHLAIDRVSMVMCHSAGAWTGYKMAADSDRVKSLCLFNPVCARPHKTLRPQFAIHFAAWLMRIKSIHFILMPLFEVAYANLGFVGVRGGDHLMVAQQIISNVDFEETRQHAEKISKKKLPLLFAYTLNDKLIERSVSEEMLFQHLNIPPSLVTKVDADKNQTSLFGSSVDGSESGWFARGVQCERGGHVVHKAYSHIMMSHVMDILHHVKKTQF